jgi:hypothetical protein
MRGNTVSPLAALLAPLLGYAQGEVKKREQDKAEEERVREAMRRAGLEEQELGMQRESLGLRRREADRLDRNAEQAERERARAAGERSGSLARRALALQQLREAQQAGTPMHQMDLVALAEAGIEPSALKALQPYDPKNDPDVHREGVRHRNSIAEIDRRAAHELGIAATRAKLAGGGGAGTTPEEVRRLQVANANFGAALRAVAADMGELDLQTQERMWQDALRRAGLDPLKFGSQMPADPAGAGEIGQFDPNDGMGGMLTDTLFMQSLGIQP